MAIQTIILCEENAGYDACVVDDSKCKILYDRLAQAAEYINCKIKDQFSYFIDTQLFKSVSNNIIIRSFTLIAKVSFARENVRPLLTYPRTYIKSSIYQSVQGNNNGDKTAGARRNDLLKIALPKKI